MSYLPPQSGSPSPEPTPGETTWYGPDESRPTQPIVATPPTTPAPEPPTSPMEASNGPSYDVPPAEATPTWASGVTTTGGGVATKPRSRRWLELGTVAVLAGVVGGGGVYAAVNQNGTTPLASVSSSPSRDTFTPNTTQAVAQVNGNAPDWTATAATASPSVVAITIRQGSGDSARTVGQGSGVIIDSSGHVLTNNHVATAGGTATSTSLQVTLDDKRTYDATIVGTDAATDLAVIKLTKAPGDLKPISFGDDNQLKVGDPVMAVGNPLGLAGTVTTGIVSALNRPVTTGDEEDSNNPFDGTTTANDVVTNAIQTSAAINPGNSGGALVNANGQLIGINSSIATTGSSGGNIGIGFAIPVTEAKSVAEQLISTGKVRHAMLGVGARDVFVQEGDAKRAAAGVASVGSGSAAAAGGLKSGDAIVAVDGETVDSSVSLTAQIRARNVGDKVSLTVVRDGKRQDIEVTLGERTAG